MSQLLLYGGLFVSKLLYTICRSKKQKSTRFLCCGTKINSIFNAQKSNVITDMDHTTRGPTLKVFIDVIRNLQEFWPDSKIPELIHVIPVY